MWAVAACFALIAGAQLLGQDEIAVFVLGVGSSVLVTTIVCVRTVRSRGRTRFGWGFITAAMVANLIGDILYEIYFLTQDEVPGLSVADASYLAFYPLLLIGVGAVITARSGDRLREVLTDAAALTLVAGLAIWQFFVVNPGLAVEGPVMQRIVFAAYPMMDMLVVAALFGLLMAPARRTPAVLFIGAFAGTLLVADLVYNWIVVSGADRFQPLSDAIYTVAYALLSAAAIMPSASSIAVRPSSAPRATGKARVALLGFAMIGAPTIAVVTPKLGFDYQAEIYIVAAGLIGTLVLLRLVSLVGSLHEEHRRMLEAEARLAHQAHHDELTGLPNRTLLLAELDRAIMERPDETAVALLFIDLDNFKVVNDSLGHGAGDEMLQLVGERIGRTVRDGDMVARLGGDEFVVLCRNLATADVAVQLADRIIAALVPPLELDGDVAFANGSIGIALVEDHHREAAELLRDADIAMYRAKAAGGKRVRVFDASMRQWAEDRRSIEVGLRVALERGGLGVAYQPRVDLETGLITGVEALLRWPERADVSPAKVIEVAELAGLIGEVGSWVLNRACHDIGNFNRGREHPIGVAVNVSPLQLGLPGLIDTVRDAIARNGVQPAWLTLELTETYLSEDPENATRTLGALRDLGIRLEIDDFGIGYSSMARLSRIPVDGLKIDRTFVMALGAEESATSVVSAIVALGKAFELEVTAEGVETSEHVTALRAIGCDLAQGYLFSRPVTLAEVDRQLRLGQERTGVILAGGPPGI